MNQSSIDHKIDEILNRENRYDRAAYGFVAQGVTFTVGRFPAHRHVSALELLYGLRDFARQEYGPMAPMVLEAWGLKYASDVGRIVYLLIDAKLLSASPEDDPNDFNIDFALCAPEDTGTGDARQEPPPPLPRID